NEKIRTPVTERENEAEAHDEAKRFDAHEIRAGTAHPLPRMRQCRGKCPPNSGPAASVLQPKKNKGSKSRYDQEELKHLVVNRTRETSEEDVGENNQCGNHDANVKNVFRAKSHESKRRIKDVENLYQLGHRVH